MNILDEIERASEEYPAVELRTGQRLHVFKAADARRDGAARRVPRPTGASPVPLRPRDAGVGPAISITPAFDCTQGERVYRQQRDAYIRSLENHPFICGLAASGRRVTELQLEDE